MAKTNSPNKASKKRTRKKITRARARITLKNGEVFEAASMADGLVKLKELSVINRTLEESDSALRRLEVLVRTGVIKNFEKITEDDSPNKAGKQLTRLDVSSYESNLNEEIFSSMMRFNFHGDLKRDKQLAIARVTGKRCFVFSSGDILDANTKSVLSHLRLISNEESSALTAFDVLRLDEDVDYEFVQQFGKAITESHEPVLIVFNRGRICGILTTGITINSHMESYMSGMAITFSEKRGHIISSMQGEFGRRLATSPDVKYYVFEPVA